MRCDRAMSSLDDRLDLHVLLLMLKIEPHALFRIQREVFLPALLIGSKLKVKGFTTLKRSRSIGGA